MIKLVSFKMNNRLILKIISCSLLGCWTFKEKIFMLQMRANSDVTNLIKTVKGFQKSKGEKYHMPKYLVDQFCLNMVQTLIIFEKMNISSGDVKMENVLACYTLN